MKETTNGTSRADSSALSAFWSSGLNVRLISNLKLELLIMMT